MYLTILRKDMAMIFSLAALLISLTILADTPIWEGAPPTSSDFTSILIADGIQQPMGIDISVDGDLFVIGRLGDFYALENNVLNKKGTRLSVKAGAEGGLIGFVLDPNFSDNRYGYFHYSAPNVDLQRVSRITINNDNTLDFSSESIVIEYPVQREKCCHLAGDLAFDSQGNLFIATGDNTNSFKDQGYTPIDESAGRKFWDAQRTSSNTNDLRGKILRIRPLPQGGYDIPSGNLFPEGVDKRRPEIFTMGNRNPFRISIDQFDDSLFWGEIGPDAAAFNPDRGPAGQDEINKTRVAGNYGWPYFIGQNEPYNDYDFETHLSSGFFNPNDVQNHSPNNTGTIEVPSATPSWIKISHRALMVGDVYRWRNDVNDAFKMPSYFNGRVLAWDFNVDQMFEADTTEIDTSLRNWLDTSAVNGLIDIRISPSNHRLYIIAFGGNCCARPNNRGQLFEVRYTGPGYGAKKNDYAINAGGPDFLASDGTQFAADAFSNGGNSYLNQSPISGTDDDVIFASSRWNTGGFTYEFPLKNGDYNVTLLFSEPSFSRANDRVFHIDIEGKRVVTDLDLYLQVGKNTAYSREFATHVKDGSLKIDFISKIENPTVSGIKVTKSAEIDSISTVSIRANINAQFVSVSGAHLVASASNLDLDTYFIIEELGSNQVAIKSRSLQKYISANSGSPLTVNATSIGANERFVIVDQGNGIAAIKSVSNGLYIGSGSSGSEAFIADKSDADASTLLAIDAVDPCDPQPGTGIECRVKTKPYLNMPHTPSADLSNVPALLSDTGAFADTESLTPNDHLIPYDLIAPLWSDNATKRRWFAIPTGKQAKWRESDKWAWPAGSEFIKHFEMPLDDGDASNTKRLETRLLVVQQSGAAYGVTYKWNETETDAELLTESAAENLTIERDGGSRVQTWTYPSPADCLTCHNTETKGIIGPKTAALNMDYTYPSGITDNQLRTWNHLGLFTNTFDEQDIAQFPKHANINDSSKTKAHRVRSYWDMNCSYCHGTTSIASNWDARYETPLADQGIVSGAVAGHRDYLADYNLPNPLIVAPGNPLNSILYLRDKSSDPSDRMPPLGRAIEDVNYINVLSEWINELPNADDYVPGLNFGTYYGGIDDTIQPTNFRITTDLAETEDAIADNTTEVFKGQLFDADGNISFTENIDDKVRLWIDGTLVLSNDTWNARSSTPNLSLTPGWHDIELRISNVLGGSGPVTTPGFGFDPDGGTAWLHPNNPGNGSLFRTKPSENTLNE